MGTEPEPTIQEEQTEVLSDLEKKIIRQVEHYFGNYNLCKDKFMKEQIKLDDGWVPLAIMVTFNRLKSLSDDFETICSALKKSSTQLMQVHEDGTKIRRSTDKPLPEDSHFLPESTDTRSLYVKGFKKNTSLDQILDFFRDHKAEYVCMRRVKGNSKVFKGSCFILFETLEDAEKFLEIKNIKFQGIELLKEKKKDYMARKDIFYQNLREEKAKKVSKGTADDQSEKQPEVEELTVIPGCLLKVEGLGERTTREDLQKVLEPFGTVVYVDYSKGQADGVVRFETGVAAKALEAAIDEDGVKKMEFGSVKATVSSIEGDAEAEYWKSIAINKANARLRFQQFQRQNKGRFGKNKNWGNKRQNWNQKRNNRDGDSSDQPPSKKMRGVEKGESSDQSSKETKAEAQDGNSDQPSKKVKADVIDSSDQPPSKKQKVGGNEDSKQVKKENGSPAAEVKVMT